MEHQKNEQPPSRRAKSEAGNIFPLLGLRGHFAFSPPSPEPERQFSPLDGIRQVFSLTDEHILLFFQQHVTLLNIHDQEILWTLTWPPSIHAVLFRDGIFVLAGSRSLFLWNMLTDQLIQTFHPMRYLPVVEENGETFSPEARSFLDFFFDISFSRDGSLMALALGWSGAAQLWNVATGQYLFTLEPEEEYPTGNSVAISPDGQIIATGNCEEGNVSIWRAADGQFVTRLSGKGRVGDLVFSPDGHILAYGDGTGDPDRPPAVHAWDTRTWQEITDFTPNTYCVVFSNDGKLLATVPKKRPTFAYPIHVWDVETRKKLCSFEHPLVGTPKAFSSNSSLLISSTGATVRWWDIQSQQEVYRLETPSSLQSRARFGHDASLLVTSSCDGVIRLWKTPELKLLHMIYHPHVLIEGVVSFDHKHVAAIGRDLGMVDLFVRQRGEAPLKYILHRTRKERSLAFSHDGTVLVTGRLDGTIHLWQPGQSNVQDPLRTFQGSPVPICSLAFRRDGRLLAAGSEDGTLFLWHTEEEGVAPVILAGHAQAAICLAFSRDGRWLVSGSEDHTVRLWDTVSGACVRVLKGHGDAVVSVAFNHAGTHVASCSQDKSVRVWNIADRMITRRAQTKPSGIVQRVQMLTGEGPTFQSLQEQVLLWTLLKGVTYYEVEQENTLPTSVAFRKDDTLLVSGYYSGPAKIWSLNEQKLRER